MNSLDTQICTVCHEEKPLSAFHRRGIRRQRICKSCRKALPASTPRPSKQQNDIAYAGQRIAELDARIRMTVSRYSRDPMQADDIYGYVVERLLKAIRPDDTDAYILRLVSLRAADFIRSEEAYTFYADVEDVIMVVEDNDNVFERFVPNSVSTEDQIVLREMSAQIAEAMSALSEDNREIVMLIADGVKPAEIARRMNISRAAVSSRLQTIRASMSMSLA